jgi:hypothetical protein
MIINMPFPANGANGLCCKQPCRSANEEFVPAAIAFTGDGMSG